MTKLNSAVLECLKAGKELDRSLTAAARTLARCRCLPASESDAGAAYEAITRWRRAVITLNDEAAEIDRQRRRAPEPRR